MQHPELRKELLRTKVCPVYAAKEDPDLGIGYAGYEAAENLRWWGTNLLGEILLQLKHDL